MRYIIICYLTLNYMESARIVFHCIFALTFWRTCNRRSPNTALPAFRR